MEEKNNRRFTIEELKRFDDNEGRPAYVAVRGKVYDVSGSRLWSGGRHMGIHGAGEDLTKGIENAPHGEDVLQRVTLVGEIAAAESRERSLTRRLADLYPHPIIAHFPIVLSNLVPLFSVLYLLTGETSFELASYYVLVLGFLAAPICGLAGAFSWRVNYHGKRSRAFNRKIVFTALLAVLTTACFAWRTLDPGVLISRMTTSYIYLILQVSLALIAAVLGHTGGKIVFS